MQTLRPLLIGLVIGLAAGLLVAQCLFPDRFTLSNPADGQPVLLDRRTGDTWFISQGYWKKLPRQGEKP